MSKENIQSVLGLENTSFDSVTIIRFGLTFTEKKRNASEQPSVASSSISNISAALPFPELRLSPFLI